MFKRYKSKPFGLVKKIRNRSSSRVSSLPEEESLLHKSSGSVGVGVRVEPIVADITSDPGIKEFQEYYKITQDLSRLEVQVEKIREKANMFRNASVLNSNSNDEADNEAGDDMVLPTN